MDSGIRFRGDSESIRRCCRFPVYVKKDEGEEEGKGQEGKEEEEITPGQTLMEQRY